MRPFNADLHIHSLHSIGVSKNMTIPNLSKGAEKKGIHIIGTGDATQPDWLDHLEHTLVKKGGSLAFEGVYFVLTVEIEDKESIHHLILLPNFEAVRSLRNDLGRYSPNIDHTWGGRPRVNLQGETLAGIVRDNDGMIGPAHAFTPFKAIFREGRHDGLAGCYGEEARHIHFIELGLSADSAVADHIPELRDLTYITSSDAHSPGPDKLGREYVAFNMESPTFDELRLAILRRNGRRPLLNVGFDPRLGKYYLSFCSSCRRTLVVRQGEGEPEYDDLNIYISVKSSEENERLLRGIHRRKVFCPADGKKLRLGVRDRAMQIGEAESVSPKHRPPYLHMPPLLDLMSNALNIKAKNSKRLQTIYDQLRTAFGPETEILTRTSISNVARINEAIARMLEAYREGTIRYVPGGGGRYGTFTMPWESDAK
ncbi:MAG: phosphotransferase [Candidatus Thorarchaeota archaeon]|nr:phosphotransferase [Candidatus Thorarchaeota archaeon]